MYNTFEFCMMATVFLMSLKSKNLQIVHRVPLLAVCGEREDQYLLRLCHRFRELELGNSEGFNCWQLHGLRREA